MTVYLHSTLVETYTASGLRELGVADLWRQMPSYGDSNLSPYIKLEAYPFTRRIAVFKKVGSPPPPKGHGGQFPAWWQPRRQAAKIRDDNATSLVTAKARPLCTSGRAALLRLHTHGEHHESANCSPGRQELQGISVCRRIDSIGTRGSRSPGLGDSGRHQPSLAISFFCTRLHAARGNKLRCQ